MATLSNAQIRRLFVQGDRARTNDAKGKSLERLICYVVTSIPGIRLYARNVVNSSRSEEIDVAFWNDQVGSGARFLPQVVLGECKNEAKPVGSNEIGTFHLKLKNRSCEVGLLIAANGITGDSAELSSAHAKISDALRDGIRIIVLTRAELERLRSSAELIQLLKMKLCQLVASGTSLPTEEK